MRENVLALSNGCVICGSHDRLELHHIRPARSGGPTVAENLAVVCAYHHRQVESGQLELPGA